MQKPDGNVCFRCGKQRIVVKTWKEHTRGGIVVHTTTTCPNPECQKVIDRQFAVQKEKQDAIEKAKQERVLAAKTSRH